MTGAGSPDWFTRSRPLDAFEVEICFQLADSFFIGDPNNAAQLSDSRFREPLALPAFARAVPTLARTEEVLGHETELARYYCTIIDRAASLEKGFNDIRHYFWMRLWIWSPAAKLSISFPWYDTFSEMQPFFAWTAAAADGQCFSDVDQGWEFTALRRGDQFHLRQANFDDGEEHENIQLSADALRDKVMAVEQRTLQVIENLTRSVGEDVWTRYRETVSFKPENRRTDRA